MTAKESARIHTDGFQNCFCCIRPATVGIATAADGPAGVIHITDASLLTAIAPDPVMSHSIRENSHDRKQLRIESFPAERAGSLASVIWHRSPTVSPCE